MSRTLIHDTDSPTIFEFDRENDRGTPKGPAWFWMYGSEDKDARFCDHNNAGGLRRRLVYEVSTPLRLRNLSTRELQDEFIAAARSREHAPDIPSVISGRSSCLDRNGDPKITEYLIGEIEEDGVVEADGKVVCIFKPEMHLKLVGTKAIDQDYQRFLEILEDTRSSIPATIKTRVSGSVANLVRPSDRILF